MDKRELFAFLILLCGVSSLKGPNVCSHKETFTQKINTTRLEPYNVTKTVWCEQIPPRCKITITNYKPVVKQELLHRDKSIVECCSGYNKSENGDLCVPICLYCGKGTCVGPNLCKCESGYSGQNCNVSCPLNLWGDLCQYDCRCKNNADCDAVTGNCTCQNGWTGPLCESKCASGTYGNNCSQLCQCRNDTCDHVTGKCLLNYATTKEYYPYNGKLESNIKTTRFGKHCNCENNGICNDETNECLCKPGWTGDSCQHPCNEGYWGKNCSQICECYNNAHCDNVTGQCICASGFIGYKCLNSCPLGTYGINCNSRCSCQNGGTCSNVDGTCTCFKNWTGRDCDINVCTFLDGRYSCLGILSEEECSRICDIYYLERLDNCTCLNENFVCDKSNACICKEGFTGSSCDIVLTSTNSLFIIVGIVIGTFVFVALVVVATLVVRSILVKSRPNLNVNDYEDFNLNYYPDPKTGHMYEEIGESRSYQVLDFWSPRNPQSSRYQHVRRFPPNYEHTYRDS